MSQDANTPSPQDGPLDDHVEDAVQSLIDLHAEHHAGSSPLQKVIDGITDLMGRPAFALALAGAVAIWIVVAGQAHKGVHAPAFAWLELAATLAALFVAVLILVSQRRETHLSERRAQLTLEMALLADKKAAKLIELLVALRRDMPAVRDHLDAETEAMMTPENPREVLDALKARDPQAGD